MKIPMNNVVLLQHVTLKIEEDELSPNEIYELIADEEGERDTFSNNMVYGHVLEMPFSNENMKGILNGSGSIVKCAENIEVVFPLSRLRYYFDEYDEYENDETDETECLHFFVLAQDIHFIQFIEIEEIDEDIEMEC